MEDRSGGQGLLECLKGGCCSLCLEEGLFLEKLCKRGCKVAEIFDEALVIAGQTEEPP